MLPSPLVLVGLALALSLAANAWQAQLYLGARDDATEARSATRQAVDAARSCSDGVAALEEHAKEQHRQAGRRRVEADNQAKTHEARAQQILVAAPAVAGDDCKSAEAAIDSWLQQRGKP
ncbi:MAG TPA: hypothetical protein VEB23_10105 [Ramlibacter sp.]|nr:hypothetical protein [Ramlibacter sp.]